MTLVKRNHMADASTGEAIGRTEWAMRVALDWKSREGVLPSVQRLMDLARVSHWAAQEGLYRLRHSDTLATC